MGFDYWIIGLGLMLILEGLLPFMSPMNWREAMRRIADMGDARIRVFGLASMLIGLLLVWVAS